MNNHHLLQNSKSFFERFDIISGLFKPLDILKNGGYPLPVIDYKKRKPYYPALKKTENDFVNYLIKIPLHPSF